MMEKDGNSNNAYGAAKVLGTDLRKKREPMTWRSGR